MIDYKTMHVLDVHIFFFHGRYQGGVFCIETFLIAAAFNKRDVQSFINRDEPVAER